jgi:hypothetical protein
MDEHQIEELLRRAPAPLPPADLKARLRQQAPLAHDSHNASPTANATPPRAGGRFRERLLHWLPILAPACLALVCVGAFAYQQSRIRELERALQELREHAAPAATIPAPEPDAAAAARAAAEDRQELQRLRGLAEQFAADAREAEKLTADNQGLRTQLAALPPTLPPEMQQFAEARTRAQSISCMNNMKQIGLSFRVWALDNGDLFPANVPVSKGGAQDAGAEQVFLVMSNELSSPKILVCPSDTNRLPAANFAAFTAANLSYQYVGANATETEPMVILVTCPIHGHVLLCDGSVQGGVAKTHPERLVQREGKLYLDTPPDKSTGVGPTPGMNIPAPASGDPQP